MKQHVYLDITININYISPPSKPTNVKQNLILFSSICAILLGVSIPILLVKHYEIIGHTASTFEKWCLVLISTGCILAGYAWFCMSTSTPAPTKMEVDETGKIIHKELI
jgi:hypothetical protein